MTTLAHYNDIDGMQGWCQDMIGPTAMIKKMEEFLKGVGPAYNHPQAGLCPVDATPSCSEAGDVKICIYEAAGTEQDVIASLHQNVATTMWGNVSTIHFLYK